MAPSKPDPKAPSSADPRAPRAANLGTPRGAEGFGDDPSVDRSEDRRTLEIGGGAMGVMVAEDEDADVDARETAPPPLPTAQYVRTMMKQVEAEEPPVSEPSPSRSPLSYRGEPPSSPSPLYRGEPRAPVSWRPRSPMDSAPTVTSMRAVDLAAEMNALAADDEVRTRVGPSAARSRGLREDDEFERRPLSLRNDEPSRAPPEPWKSAARPALPAAPAPPALEPRLSGDGDAPLARPLLRGASHAAPPPPRGAVPPPKRSLTPPAGSRPLPGPPVRKSSSSGMPTLSGNRPLPPPPIPKGPPPNPTPTNVPRTNVAGPHAKPATLTPPRPESDAAVDAELDALALDDLVAAAERSAPPPPLVTPALAKPPVPAGLRLGKEPLTSFPAAIDMPDDDSEDAAIPPILDVAWAASELDDAPTHGDGDREPFLPGLGLQPGSADPDDAIPAILDVGWAFPQGAPEGYRARDEGEFDDDLAHVDELGARLEEGDYEGVLTLAERLLALDPCDARALGAADAARERLVEARWEALGGRRRVPCVTMTPEDIRWLSLDHRAGFLLSCIDGRMSLEEVLDVATMPEFDALRLIGELHAGGVISFDPPGPRSGRR
jgi:hypothetical protein